MSRRIGVSMKRLPARFYRTTSGTEPVREWLMALPREERAVIGKDIAMVEFGWPIGMPTCRPLGDGLHEVRSDLPGNRTARVMFCIHEGSCVLLHGFIKKTQKAPKADIDLATARKREVTR